MTFAAADEADVRISLSETLWDELRTACCWSTDSDDMRDYGLLGLEGLVADGDERVVVEHV